MDFERLRLIMEKHENDEEKHSEHHEDSDEGHDFHESKIKGPVKMIIGLFLLLIVVLWLVPFYGVKINPEPTMNVGLEDIQLQFLNGVEIGNETGTSSIKEAASRIKANDPVIKQVATSIATQSCTDSKICHAKALYYFVRDNIQYVSDPNNKEYIASPIETLKTGGGDCDDGAILLANLLESVGIKTNIVVIPGHAMIKSAIPELSPKYLIDGWVHMDWTCSECGFGEVSYQYVPQLSN